MRNSLVRVAVVALAIAANADYSFGQAWVGPKGSGSVNIDAQFVEGDGLIVDRQNLALFKGIGFDNDTLTMNLEYVPFENWGVRAEVPYSMNQLKSPNAAFEASAFGRLLSDGHPSSETLTDFSDFALEVRRGFTYKDWAFAPFFGFSLPMTTYEIKTARQPGRGLSEARVGVNAGRKLGEKAYMHFRYMYSSYDTFGERGDFALEQNKLSQDNASFELGWFVNKKVTLKGNMSFRDTQGGIECETAIVFGGRILGGVANADDIRGFNFHRALRNEEFVTARIEGEYTFNDNWSAYAAWTEFVDGDNIIPFTDYISVGATWGFQ